MTMPAPSPIPMLDLAVEVDALWPEIEPALRRVLRSGHFIGGPEVEGFEREVAAYLGVRHAIGLNSGTDALVIGLEALGIGPGDEVLTTPFSFFATSEAILRVGATPVFVDIEPETFNLDAWLLEDAVTPRTRAVLPVHLFGLPADMETILDVAARHDLRVLEDCAQAFGARHAGRRVGTLGDLGAYSFYPTKNLGAYGDAGLLATNDDATAERARRLRTHGSRPDAKYVHDMLGHNSRLDALQAAILRVKLPHVEAWNEQRRAVARALHEGLAPLAGVTPPQPHPEHVFHQFTVRVAADRVEAFRAALDAQGVASQRFYPVPLSDQPVDARASSPPEAARAATEVVSLPVHPFLGADEVERIVGAVRGALEG